jgi:hypothetical protein
VLIGRPTSTSAEASIMRFLAVVIRWYSVTTAASKTIAAMEVELRGM